VIHLGGDRVPPGNVESYKTHFGPGCIFVTGLASVETGRVRQYFLDKETLVIGESVSLGYMVEGIEITLLGEDGTPVGFNQVGEIAVKSCYLSPGYWRMPDQTDAVFLPDAGGGCERIYLTGDLGKMLLDGCLVHMGRKDSQVKIRGYSVAVVEIEAALQNLGGIKEVVVMAREDRNGDQRLVAYLVSAQQPAPRVSGLRKLLKEKLPDYMVPSQFVLLDAIPKLPSGKTDRRALPQPGTARPELDNKYSPPS